MENLKGLTIRPKVKHCYTNQIIEPLKHIYEVLNIMELWVKSYQIETSGTNITCTEWTTVLNPHTEEFYIEVYILKKESVLFHGCFPVILPKFIQRQMLTFFVELKAILTCTHSDRDEPTVVIFIRNLSCLWIFMKSGSFAAEFSGLQLQTPFFQS